MIINTQGVSKIIKAEAVFTKTEMNNVDVVISANMNVICKKMKKIVKSLVSLVSWFNNISTFVGYLMPSL